MIETWFKIAISAFLPIIAAFLLPASFKPYCLIAAGLLMVTAVIVMVRQDRSPPHADALSQVKTQVRTEAARGIERRMQNNTESGDDA